MENILNSVNYIDMILAVPLLWFCYKGFKNGIIVEIASLLALVLGIYGAYHFSGFAAKILTDNVGLETEYISLISFGITFIGIVIIVHLISKLVDRLVKAVALGFVSRILGLVFGVVKFAFIFSILLTLLNRFDKNNDIVSSDLKETSFLYKPISEFAPMVFPYLSLDKFEEVEKKIIETAT